MIALTRMRLAGFVQTGRAAAPLFVALVVLSILYGGGQAAPGEAYGVSAAVLFAVLAWQTVTWALRTGGAEVRAAVADAFSRAAAAVHRANEVEAPPRAEPVMEAHGRLDPATLARVTAATMVNVVAPAARALLQPEAKATSAAVASLRV